MNELDKKTNMGYVMLYDYHTHTTFSHGKGSIKDNIEVARKKGLKAIAISDHGPGHLTYGVSRDKIPQMRGQIARLNELYDDIDIYLSVEANIASTGNYLDVAPMEFANFDFVIAGYHYGIKHGFCIKNFLNNNLPGSLFYKELLVKNTDMAVRALYENDIKILTHPGDKGPFDIAELAKACEKTDTLMEISTWHSHLTLDEIKICAKTDVKFVISSDAHTPNRVGDFEKGLARAIEAGLDPARIVNIIKTEA